MIGNPIKINALISEVDSGEILLPEIQRGYVWKREQVVQLLDSLYREYPTGSILLWDTKELPVTKEMQGQRTSSGVPNFPPKIVLDGQQRLTSLYKIFKGDEKIRIYFNLETEDFQLYAPSLKNQPLWIDITDVFQNRYTDYEILLGIQDQLGIPKEDQKNQLYLDRIQGLRKVAEYKYPIEIFRCDDYEEATNLFIRINSGGTRLREAELALARLAWRLPGSVSDTFERTLEEYEGYGFHFDTRFLMRCLVAIATGQSRFRHLGEFWKKDPNEIQSNWERTQRGLEAAVNFMRGNARLESSEWLPSLNALVPLVVYFQGQRGITPATEHKLLYWFYQASMHGRYSGSAETVLDQDLRVLETANPVDALISNLPSDYRRPLTDEDLEGKGAGSPLFMMSYVVTRKNNARDWFTGLELNSDSIGESHSIEIHHIFPKALLRDNGIGRYERDDIANLAFLAQKANRQISKSMPIDYLKEIYQRDPERLKAQFIPIERQLWEVERYSDFCCVRRRLIAEAINDEIARLVS